MEKNKGVIRELLKYEYELGHNAKEATRNINRAKRTKKVDYATAKRWYSKFRSGKLDVADKKRVRDFCAPDICAPNFIKFLPTNKFTLL